MEKIKREVNNEGVTLISLIVIIVILFIISGIAISSGIETADSIKITKFNKELQLIQGKVDVIYEQLKSGEKQEADLGGESYTNNQSVMDSTFNALNIYASIRGNYKYYTSATLKTVLGLEDISQSVLINWETRDVISAQGIKIDGEMYYRYEGWYKPEYTENEPKDIELETTLEINGDIKKVIVTVTVKDTTNKITDFTLKYKLKEEEDKWKIADFNFFEIAIPGTYQVQVSGNGIVTKTTEIILE